MSSSLVSSGEQCQQNAEINSLYFEIRSSENFGRYLVAKEDVAEKTLILSETPVVFGPSDEKDFETNVVSVYCISCCKLLHPLTAPQNDKQTNSYESLYNCCTNCGFPVCDKHCEKAPIHSENECKFFSSIDQHKNFPPPHQWLMYKTVILLRILLLMKDDSESVWENFLEKLEHHTECRESKDNCVRADEIVLENLDFFTEALTTKRKSVSKKNGRKYRLPFLDDKLTLKRIIGTLNVNSFCANNNETNRIARCMFKYASLFAHSCAPNCYWTVEVSLMDHQHSNGVNAQKNGKKHKSKNGIVNKPRSDDMQKITPEIQIYTAVEVKKGEMLTIPYSTRHIFCGTLKRQVCMESVGHFICKCYRCMDPTELGTYMSSVRCFKCESGFLVSSNPSDQDAKWTCVKSCESDEPCGYQCSVGKVVYFVSNIQDQIDRIGSLELHWKEEQEKLQKIFHKYRGTELHENHYVLLELSTDLVEMLAEKLFRRKNGNIEDDMEVLSVTETRFLVDRFLLHVGYLASVANVIMPGFNNYQEQLQSYLEEGEALKLSLQPTS